MSQGEASTGRDLVLFAYGTLKRGFENHERYCRGARAIQPAAAWGRLRMPTGAYPALEVPHDTILYRGTAQIDQDLARFEALRRSPEPPEDPGRLFQKIRGDLVLLPNPRERLPILDAFEGFRPRAPSGFARVLLPLFVPPEGAEPRIVVAWAYVAPPGREPSGPLTRGDSWVGRSD